jgi:Cof subfamily protein (haloacid dehalogenase superfamily)
MTVTNYDGILFVSDMDGTLLDGRSQISRENQQALQYFVDHGGLFTIATGRMERSVEPYLPLLPVNAPLILYNGAVIYDPESRRRLFQVGLAEEIRAIVQALMARFPELGIEVYHGERIYFLQKNEETENHKAKEGFVPGLVAMDQLPGPWIKILLSWEPARLAEVEAWLPERPELFRTVYSEPHFLELLPPGVSKGAALQKLVGILGRPDLKTVCMGDNPNDQEMIEVADLGVAVANAHPALQRAADFISRRHDAHAVAEVVERLGRAAFPGWQAYRRDA